jgi:hypothetical protein
MIKGNEKQCGQSKGDVDIICGGSCCQGISGFYRFKNYNESYKMRKPANGYHHGHCLLSTTKVVFIKNFMETPKFADGYHDRYT